MAALATLALLAPLYLSGVACTRPTPGYCGGDGGARRCGPGTACNPTTLLCEPSDAGASPRSATAATPARQAPRRRPRTGATEATRGDASTDVARPCTGNGDCTMPDGGRACLVDAGLCVECVVSGDCKTAAAPICETNACRACKTDAECPDPGICMEDGHCATGGEVLFVEYKPTGCPGAAGTSASPYCLIADAIARLRTEPAVTVLAIRGPANDQLSLSLGGAFVVVGKTNSAGVGASIPAVASTAITIANADVLIRDLTVAAGTTPASRGVVAGDPLAKARLLRVTVSLGQGLGVSVSDGAGLDMDRCMVQNNSGGGILTDGAGYSITNTVIANNGPGRTGSTTWGGVFLQNLPVDAVHRFVFDTVVNNNASGISCTGAYPVSASIIYGNTTGAGAGCAIATCCPDVDPRLTTDFHLMSGSACVDQVTDAMMVTHDLDGQPRPRGPKSDCGADEL